MEASWGTQDTVLTTLTRQGSMLVVAVLVLVVVLVVVVEVLVVFAVVVVVHWPEETPGP